jgi:hypothetical protein
MRISRSARWLLLALLVFLIPASSFAGVFISVGFAPPVLPVYVQPICPEPGLMWTPGYWAYGDDGYYWVPGAWVPAPYVGALWTPGYWGWSGGMYMFHGGYWGPHIGYYGGVNYGFGYGGIGFAGGIWRGGIFSYNTAVMHVGVGGGWGNRVYVDHTVVERGFVARDSHVALSGGPGGIRHDPSPEERIAEHDQHRAPSAIQAQHAEAARADKTSYARNNGGHPATLAVAHPLGASHGPVEAHGAIGAHPAGPAAHSMPESRPAPAYHATPAAPHTEAAPRSMAEPRPAPAPRAAPAPRPAPAPRSAPAPRPSPEGHKK